MKRILLGTDGTESAVDAELEAVELATGLGAELVVAYAVLDPMIIREPGNDHIETLAELAVRFDAPFARALELARSEGLEPRLELREGLAQIELPAVARDVEADLIVVGARQQHAFARLLLGSVSRAVLAQTRRPILIVKRGAHVRQAEPEHPEPVASPR
jgi:nucleotide-binding universal stress UspA family protein